MNKLLLILFVAALVTAPTAFAEPTWGLRGGVTFDPDQVHVGAHVFAGEVFDNTFFLPNVEIGFGDNITLVAINPELVYRFPREGGSRWGFHAGGGLGINIFNWHDEGDPHDHHASQTDLGLNILGGMRRALSSGHEFFWELKLGIADSPDAKITVGISFE